MSVPFPVPLMTAAERAGFRAACDLIRAEGCRMRRASLALSAPDAAVDPVATVHQAQKQLLLDLCGKAVVLCADRAAAQVTNTLH